MTECSPVVAVNTFDFREPGFFQPGSRRRYVGRPLPGVAVRVVHSDTFEPLGADTEGLVLVKGPNVMQGYLGRDDLTEAAFVDGWYDTGDLGFLSEDGFLGPLLGAAVLESLQQYLTQSVSGTGTYLIIYGGLFLAVILLLPRGVVPSVTQFVARRRARSLSGNEEPRDTSVRSGVAGAVR